MPDTSVACTPEQKKKILGMSVGFVKDLGKFVAWLLSATLALVAFYFISEAKQELRISDNKTKSEKTEERFSDHLTHSTKAFDRTTTTLDKLNSTMEEQRKVISATRETLSGLNATQQEIKRENGRLARSIEELAKEVRKQNGSGP